MTLMKLTPSYTREVTDYILESFDYDDFNEDILENVLRDNEEMLTESDFSNLFDTICEAYSKKEFQESLRYEEEPYDTLEELLRSYYRDVM